MIKAFPKWIELINESFLSEEFKVNHSYNAQQIEWFKAGGALNIIRASVN
jgi:aconitate hydratase